MKKVSLLILFFSVNIICIHAQNIFPSAGRTGIYTNTPVTSFQVNGGARIGKGANYVNIDSATGNLSFSGTGGYQVAGNKYAFQYSGNPNYGLFFNSTNVQYEFRNGSASSVFSIGANTGNGVFTGGLQVGNSASNLAGNIRWTGTDFQGYNGATWQSFTTGATYTGDGTTGINVTGSVISALNTSSIWNAGQLAGTPLNGVIPPVNGQVLKLSGGKWAAGTDNDAQTLSIVGNTVSISNGNNITLPPSNAWGLNGNAGTSPATNFIGTTDAQPLVFKVSNFKAGYIDISTASASFGSGALLGNTSGIANAAFGYRTLLSNTTGGNNTAVGSQSLYLNTLGNNNTAIGVNTSLYNTSGSFNTAAGNGALLANSTGSLNTAMGSGALSNNLVGSEMVAVGDSALFNQTGTLSDKYGNVGVGSKALYANTTGYYNTATGNYALQANTTGINNNAFGFDALHLNTSGSSNSAFGDEALSKNTTGMNNVAVGSSALSLNSTGSSNVAVGNGSLNRNTTGTGNVATGYQSLISNSTGDYNVANGYLSLNANTTGAENVASGYSAMQSNTTGYHNVANGSRALYSNTSGNNNVANGCYALNFNTVGEANTASGYFSLATNTTGIGNTAIGSNSLESNTTGRFNTGTGYAALDFNTTGYGNTATGLFALSHNTTANNNVAIGNVALYSSEGNSSNVAIGDSSLYSYNDLNYDDYMVAVGTRSLKSNTTGYYNTSIGGQSMFRNTTGGSNTALGVQALFGNINGSFNTAVGYAADVSASNLFNATAIGYGAIATASYQVKVGNSSVTSIGGYVNWTNFSDGRYKKNIKENVPGLEFINKLRPVTYTLDVNAIENKLAGNSKEQSASGRTTGMQTPIMKKALTEKSKTIFTGFVAQDVEKAAASINYDFSGVDKPAGDKQSFYGLRYSDFVVPLVKAVQELSKQNDDLKKQNDDIKNEVTELKKIVLSMQPTTNLNPVEDKVTNQFVELGAVAKIDQNVPNPFSSNTSIDYYLPVNYGNAYINFYNNAGNLLKSVKLTGTGNGTIQLKAAGLPSGSYRYTLVIGNQVIESKQMIEVK